MKNKKIKYLITAVLAVVVLSVVATVGIGSYFVNYALVPNQGRENRNVKPSTANDSLPDDEKTFEKNKKQDILARDIWFSVIKINVKR